VHKMPSDNSARFCHAPSAGSRINFPAIPARLRASRLAELDFSSRGHLRLDLHVHSAYRELTYQHEAHSPRLTGLSSMAGALSSAPLAGEDCRHRSRHEGTA
jgi:hypothetical protein